MCCANCLDMPNQMPANTTSSTFYKASRYDKAWMVDDWPIDDTHKKI